MSDFAARLVAARRAGTVVESDIPALKLDKGYAIAKTVWASLGTPAGWKIGATNARGQAFLGIAAPICGRVFGAGIFESGLVPVTGNRRCEAEPEILIRIGEDGGIAAAHLGLEIVRPSSDTPFDHGVGFIVADNAAHVALVVGPEIDPALLDTPDVIMVRFGPHTGTAANVLGNPRVAVAWLARARTLVPGDWIATGAITAALPLDGEVIADFGHLGKVMARKAE